MIIFSSTPITPLLRSFFIELCPGSYLLLKPSWIFGLNFLIIFLQEFTFFISRSNGFSQKTIFLCLVASLINLIWVGVLEAIKTISEIGCGYGFHAEMILKNSKPKNYIAVDITTEAIEATKKRHRSALNLRVLQGKQ